VKMVLDECVDRLRPLASEQLQKLSNAKAGALTVVGG